MRKDGAFRIYEISYEIRPGKCRYGGVKEQNRKIHNLIFHVGFPTLKCFKTAPVLHIDIRSRYIPLRYGTSFSSLCPTVSEHQHQS